VLSGLGGDAMTFPQFIGLLAYSFWSSWLVGEAQSAKLRFSSDPAYDIGPQRRTVSACERWQFCDEWRTKGPDGRMIERRVI